MTDDRQPRGSHQHGSKPGHGPGRAHSHSHAHGDGAADWDAMALQLEHKAEIQLPSLTSAAEWLRGLLQRGAGGGPAAGVRRVLDVGCGPGVAACLLAEVFAAAEVVAVDASPLLLERARTRAARAGVGSRFRVLEAELPGGLDVLGSADLIWTSQTVHHLGDQQDALARLAGAVRPGGLLAVAEGGLPLRFLPRDLGIGRPGLQARLEAANEDWFAEMRADLPQSVSAVEDWPAMLERAGLEPAGSRTFLVDRPAPAGEQVREYLHGHLRRVRDFYADRLADDDVRTLDVLLDDSTPASIRRRPDTFCLTALTVHTARSRHDI